MVADANPIVIAACELDRAWRPRIDLECVDRGPDPLA
jgi:hypothetical protein